MYPGQHALKRANEPLYIMAGSGEVVTFAHYEQAANRIAHLVRSAGLQPGDHVSLLFENNPRMLEVEGAAERAGLYFTAINSHLSAQEAAYIVNDSRSRIVFTSAAMSSVAAELPVQCPDVERWFMTGADDPPTPYEPLESVLAGFPDHPIEDERAGMAMLYSSGTTGRPKGILRKLPECHPAEFTLPMEFFRDIWHFREGLTYLSPAPLYHSAPYVSVALATRMGATTIIMEHFDPASFLEQVERHRVTHTQVVPTMFSRLLKLPEEVRMGADTSSLERIIHSAAPCPIQVKEAIIDWLGPIVTEYYSATEAYGYTVCDSEEWLAHRGTVGRPVLGELLILDDEGKPVPTGTPGTVWFRGAPSFEYFNDPDKTAQSRDASGEASTVGDVGYVDDDGYLYLTDRKTYMIISGGVNIYPQETENLLVTHPKVVDAAVIGVPNEDLGEEVKAVVQPADGFEAGPELEAELLAFCRAHLSHYKCPRSIDFEAELPRLPTGKLYKRLLRDRYWTGHAQRLG